jgi:hypothetical protein
LGAVAEKTNKKTNKQTKVEYCTTIIYDARNGNDIRHYILYYIVLHCHYCINYINYIMKWNISWG